MIGERVPENRGALRQAASLRLAPRSREVFQKHPRAANFASPIPPRAGAVAPAPTTSFSDFSRLIGPFAEECLKTGNGRHARALVYSSVGADSDGQFVRSSQ